MRGIGGVIGGMIGVALAGAVLYKALPIDFANASGWYLIGLTAFLVAAPILGIWAGSLYFHRKSEVRLRIAGGIIGGVLGFALAGSVLYRALPIDFANANGWYLIGLTAFLVAAPILGIWAGSLYFK